MKKSNKVIFMFLSIFLMVSCNTNDDFNEVGTKLELEDKILSVDEIKNLKLKLINFKSKEQLLISNRSSESSSSEIQKILKPLYESGKEIHIEMITFLKKTGEFDKYTQEDKDKILNMNESQLAELGFLTSMLISEKKSTTSKKYQSRALGSTIRSCLATAVGIGAIRDLISNTAALGAVETTIGALKLIGRRYLGWIGVGLMVLDFADCYYGLIS